MGWLAACIAAVQAPALLSSAVLPHCPLPLLWRPTTCFPVTHPPSPPQSAQAFADKINAAGGNATLFVYDGSGHGFLNVGEEVRRMLGRASRGTLWRMHACEGWGQCSNVAAMSCLLHSTPTSPPTKPHPRPTSRRGPSARPRASQGRQPALRSWPGAACWSCLAARSRRDVLGALTA